MTTNASVAKFTGTPKTKDGEVNQKCDYTPMEADRKFLPGKSRYGVDGVGGGGEKGSY